jgi:nitroreductase
MENQKRKINYNQIIILFLMVVMIILLFKEIKNSGIMAKNQIKDALTAIYERKSVRNFTGDIVESNELDTLLKAAMCAPSAVNKQPWAFIKITDQALMRQLADSLPYAKMLYESGAAIVVCGDLKKALKGVEQEFWVQDCSAASQNILIAAEAMGLGAVWTALYPVKERISFVRKTLNIPETVVPLNIICIGQPKESENPKNKFNADNIHSQRW